MRATSASHPGFRGLQRRRRVEEEARSTRSRGEENDEVLGPRGLTSSRTDRGRARGGDESGPWTSLSDWVQRPLPRVSHPADPNLRTRGQMDEWTQEERTAKTRLCYACLRPRTACSSYANLDKHCATPAMEDAFALFTSRFIYDTASTRPETSSVSGVSIIDFKRVLLNCWGTVRRFSIDLDRNYQ